MREKFYILLKEHFINLESKLNQLDAVIGDGDHGSTLLKASQQFQIVNCHQTKLLKLKLVALQVHCFQF